MEFVKTTTDDGLVLQGMLAPAASDTVILHIHGMAGNFWENSFVKAMARDYPARDIAFLSVETRGSELMRWFPTTDGRSRLVGDSYELFEECLHDIGAWVAFLESRGFTRIHLQGHSLGCAKIAYYQVREEHPLVRSLLLISPSDMVGLLLNDKDRGEHERCCEEAQALVAAGKGDELLSRIHWGFARLSANTYLNFSHTNDNLAIFNYYTPERGFRAIASLKVPMLSILGTQDDGIVTDPYESTELLEDHAKNLRGEVFEGATHSFVGYEERITRTVLEFVLNLSYSVFERSENP